PKGVTTVTVLPKGASAPITVTATWITSGSPALDLDDLGGLSDDNLGIVNVASSGKGLLRELMKRDIFNSVLPKETIEDMKQIGVSDIGSAKSMFKLPEGAKEIPGFKITAAIYEAAGKKIGILRIPEYGDNSFDDVLAKALVVMEKDTDVLVLDQTNNPGGSVSLVSDIVGLFADKSYTDMTFKLRPSLKWKSEFDDINTKIADMLTADPTDFAANALKARFVYLSQEVTDAMAQKRFLTNPVSLNLTGTFGMIQPNKSVRYTKPVLLLINELDFSGGDAFPAIMKDNGRVTLFGARTTGAGGNVVEYGPLAHSFFKFRLTESLMVRPNGAYVENYGVSPDVEYNMTEDDFMNDYRGYVKSFTVEALKLAGASQGDIDAFKNR
ncbi:MAG TPA: S41 family peptidase, partial [Bdellovibrionota bacterium]